MDGVITKTFPRPIKNPTIRPTGRRDPVSRNSYKDITRSVLSAKEATACISNPPWISNCSWHRH